MIIDGVARECQKADWKHGKPRPHKTICGKLDIDLNIQSYDGGPPKRHIMIPDPAPSFRRSAALLYQINYLKNNNCDYVVRIVFLENFAALKPRYIAHSAWRSS